MTFVPDFATELEPSFRASVKVFLEEINSGAVNADSLYVQLLASAATNGWIGSENIGRAGIAYRAARASLVVNFLRSFLDPFFLGILANTESVHTDVVAGWDDIRQWFIDNSETIKSRAITFDTTPTTSGTGDPTWRRLTVDKDGFNIESVYAENITAKPIEVQPNVAVGETQYQLTTPSTFDLFSLKIAAEKNSRALSGVVSSLNSDNEYISTSSFEIGDAASASLASFGAWIITAAALANVEIIEDGHIETVQGRNVGTSRSPEATVKFAARLKATMSFYQDIATLSESPKDWAFSVRRPAGTTAGTITMKVGSNSTCVADFSDSVTYPDDTWVRVFPTLNENLWPDNFAENKTRVEFQLTLTTGTHVDISNANMQDMTQFNGTYIRALPGTTPTNKNYRAVFNDSIPADSIEGLLIFLAYGLARGLPNAAVPSITPVT